MIGTVGRRLLKRRGFLLLLWGLALPLAVGETAADQPSALDQIVTALAPPPSSEALAQIPDPGRRLLALRSYLRYGPKIAERWSWTTAEAKTFEASPEYKALLSEIDAVKAHFKAANPGYEIYVHATMRSLDEQVAKWNANDSVGAGGTEILTAYTAKFPAAAPDPATVKQVAAWLKAFQPAKRANLAAPGLTLHGRASAIDFQVMKNGSIYAGADTGKVESIWRAEGWDQKLKASITAAGPSFTGPLTNPDEPWHYDYHPKADASLATAD
jgi:hypothetical protein